MYSIHLLKRLLLSFIPGLCLLISPVVVYADQPLASDVRVVIDISGSMKKTDPHNLRKEAVDLIVRLLPDNNKASILTFGQSVNMLVAHRIVDEAWRKEAIEKAQNINSVALYTNIGGALEKASAITSSPGYQTHIILLTDGVVDIDPEAVVNMKERSRILKEILPGIKNSDYKLHTISLSDAADQELMKKLAVATDGISQVAKNADELMTTFLRIFDQAVPAERVPLDEEGFLVDASVQEFTALIFRQSVADSTRITDPTGKVYSTTDPQNNVNWYRAANYDLITVQSPLTGQWKVTTPMAPDSRVTVVSNLSLQVNPAANNIKPSQTLDFTYQFNEADKVITKPEFLNLLTAEILVTHKGDKISRQETINTNQLPADGVFSYSLDAISETGDYDFKLTIDGKTFRREYTHHFSVVDQNFRLEKSLKEEAEKKIFHYKVIADAELVDTTKTTTKALITNSQNNNIEKVLTLIDSNRWEFIFSPVQTARYKVAFVMEGEGLDGSAINETIVAEEFYYPDEASVKADEEKNAAIEDKSEESVKSEPAIQTAADESVPAWVLYTAIAVANLLLIAVGYIAYRILMGKKGENDLDELEKTLQLDVNSLKPVATEIAPTSIDTSESVISEAPKSYDDSVAESLFPLERLDETDDKKS
jgi:uncharacterized protein (TIGR03503 family)